MKSAVIPSFALAGGGLDDIIFKKGRNINADKK